MLLPGPARTLLWGSTAVAVVTLGILLPAAARQLPLEAGVRLVLAQLATLAVLAQHFPLSAGPKRKFDVSTGVHYAIILTAPFPLATVLVSAAEALGQATLMLRRDPASGARRGHPYSLLFNTAQFTLAAAAAGAAHRWLPWPLGALAAAIVLYLVNTWLVATMVALHRRQSPIVTWLEGRGWNALQAAGMLVLGLLCAQSARHEVWIPLLMVLPAAMTVLSLKRAADAEATVRLRDEFLSVAAHELRTPLTSLRGYTQLLLREIGRQGDAATIRSPERFERALQVINTQCTKLNDLVDQLLDLSRLDAGKLTLTPSPVDLAALVRETTASLQLTTRRYRLRVHAPEQACAWVDRLRIEQVLTNLLTNAIRHADGGEYIDVEVAQEGNTIRLAVRDYGAGIPPEARSRIFERYQQLQPGGVTGGLGLGLYLTRHLVELHGGSITLESPPDGGTRFVVTLPVADAAAMATAAPPVEARAPLLSA